jgi:hypothetical protein
MPYPIAPTPRTVAESEALFERVKAYFWTPDEKDFLVRISDAPMAEWQRIPTPTVEEMIDLRCRMLGVADFAGFIWADGRYEFYFCDQNMTKKQFLHPVETYYFAVKRFSEVDIEKVVADLRMLQGS